MCWRVYGRAEERHGRCGNSSTLLTMKFIETKIKGVILIELEKKEDERGFLARTWDKEQFAQNGIDFTIMQGYVTSSLKKGTMRGFHYLKVPEQKLTRVTRGSVYEVVIDIRPKSPTYKKWQSFTLKDTDYKMFYAGPGIAHAILTLTDNTELMSLYSPAYASGNEGGIRYNDPAFNVKWPIDVKSVSKKDSSWEDFTLQDVIARSPDQQDDEAIYTIGRSPRSQASPDRSR